MKRFSPFLLVLCGMIALGVLFSGFGFLDADASSCSSAAAEEESLEEFDEEALFRGICPLAVSVTAAEAPVPKDFSTLSFLTRLANRILPVLCLGEKLL
jgi:hypothetical protein